MPRDSRCPPVSVRRVAIAVGARLGTDGLEHPQLPGSAVPDMHRGMLRVQPSDQRQPRMTHQPLGMGPAADLHTRHNLDHSHPGSLLLKVITSAVRQQIRCVRGTPSSSIPLDASTVVTAPATWAVRCRWSPSRIASRRASSRWSRRPRCDGPAWFRCPRRLPRYRAWTACRRRCRPDDRSELATVEFATASTGSPIASDANSRQRP